MLQRTTLQRSRLCRLSEVSRALLAPMPPPTFSMMRYCANLLADHWNEMLGVEVQQGKLEKSYSSPSRNCRTELSSHSTGTPE